MNSAYLCVGSNAGDRKVNILTALKLLNEYEKIELIDVSSIYETEPFGVKEQENFYNLAVRLRTEYTAPDLLMVLKTVERETGRRARARWGPREIDLDLALFGEEIADEEKLKLPHPGIFERDFFLVPLVELDENICEPLRNKKLKEYLKLVQTNHIITKFEFNISEIIGS